MARKTKLTDNRKSRFFAALKNHMTFKGAAEIAGISERTLYNWIEKGEEALRADKKSVFADFLKKLREVEAESEELLIKEIKRQSRKDWRAAAFILERRFKDRWTRVDRSEVSQTNINLETDGLSLEEKFQLIEDLKKRLDQVEYDKTEE